MEAAKRICDALRSAGVEVWFDADGGLEHGDEWDAKIRRQIKECVLFLAVISANTQAREEGYFRIEWDLAAERARGIASGVAFILPVVIDDTREPAALVPDRFRSLLWTRLPGGQVPPEVLQRFLKLWSHRAGALKHEAAGSVAAPPGGLAATPNTAGRRLVRPWLVLGAVALAAAWFVFQPRRNPEEGARTATVAPGAVAPAPPPAIPPNPPGATSGPRQLVEQARALFDALDSTRDDFKLAEDFLAQAKAGAAGDAEVWAAEAQLGERYLQRGWDTGDARREAARSAAQRALRLDPASFEARLAQAGLLAYTGQVGAEKEKLLRVLHAERPADHRILRELGSTLERRGQTDEGVALMDEAAALPGGDPLALYNKSLGYWFAGRTAEAEAAMRAAIAQKPFTGARLVSAWYAMVLHGDLDSAQVMIDQIPPADLQEDRGCFFAYFLASLRREPDVALARLQALPRDWIVDNWYRGPKSRLAGDVLQQAGRTAAAAAEWRAALKLVEDRLGASPTNTSLLYNRIHLLAGLGERAEAEKQFAVLLQIAGVDLSGENPVPEWVTNLSILLGRKSEAIRQMALGLQQRRRAVAYTAALLRLDPVYDPLRDEPGFSALVAQAEAIERSAAPPRDWPKDPALQRAWKLLESTESIPSDVALAEDMVKTVLAARPTDEEATIVMASVQTYYLLRGFDRSEDRFAQAKHFSERALALAPDDPEAMAAMATYLYRRVATELPRAAKLLRQAIALRPQEPRYYRLLDNVLSADPAVSDAEIIASARRTADRFPQDALVQYELGRHYRDAGRLEEAEQYFDLAIKLGPVANAIIGRARLSLIIHGDPAAMKAMLDRLPDRYHATDRAVFTQFVYASATGQPELGLEALRALPEPWMIDFDYTGPTSLLAGELLLQEGKTELARLRFAEAEAELPRHKTDLSRNFSTTWLEPWILLRLGRSDEARARNAVYFPELGRPFRLYLGTNWWFNPILTNLLLGERAKALALIREARDFQYGRTILRTALRFDPRMAPFRDDPEITALLAEPETRK